MFGQSGDGNWVDILPTITKRYNNRVHSPTKLTPIQACYKENEGFVYQNLFVKQKKIKPNSQVNDLVHSDDLKKTFSKEHTTNWFCISYKIGQIIVDTIPAYKKDNLPDRYNKALLEKSELTLKENRDVIKQLIIT